MPTAWSVLSAQFSSVDPIRLKIRLKPVFGHEKTPETPVFRELCLEVTPGFELPEVCIAVAHLLRFGCLVCGIQPLLVLTCVIASGTLILLQGKK